MNLGLMCVLNRLVRRDMTSYAGRYWRYVNAYLTLYPVDETQPRLGGKVKVQAFIMDWYTFTPQYRTMYGVYSDDFVTFGHFSKEAGNVLEDEETLLKICDENDMTTVPDKTTLRFENNRLLYKREVNGDVKDVSIDHPVKETAMEPVIQQSWVETFFYGLGNKSV